MADVRTRPESTSATSFSTRLPSRRLLVAALVPILLLGLVAVARAALDPARPSGLPRLGLLIEIPESIDRSASSAPVISAAGAASLTPTQLRAAAADALDAALGPGGEGISFEVVQRSTITVQPGGPRIPVPDPIDRTKTLGLADTYLLNVLIERGFATPSGFYAALLPGPAEGGQPDWDGRVLLEALQIGGTTYRNDGDGWYATDTPPGIGLDPQTTVLLSRLLRNATAPTEAAKEALDGIELRAITAGAKVADIPGVVAADGEGFTAMRGPVTFAFDADGRLVKLEVRAVNQNLKEFDLVVDTEIVIHYGAAETLPQPEPALTDTTPEVLP